jgi:hypothetical protein
VTDESSYAVGFRRSPEHSRFKPGQSGNPNGRPKGTANLATDLQEELAERIRIREGEKSLKVSKQRALLKALLAKGLKGDTRAAALVLQLVAKVILPKDEMPTETPAGLEAADVAILERFLARRDAEKK